MSTNKMWCNACNIAVEAVVKTGISQFVVPAVGAAIGGMIGGASGGKKKGEAQERAIVGSLIGGLVSMVGQAIVKEAVPVAQKLVCGNCGCEHLSHAT